MPDSKLTRPWIRRLLVPTRFAEAADLRGRHVLVTGASVGSLGLATAQTLANWGAQVVITSRRLESAQAAVASVRIRGAGQLQPAALDLGHVPSVERFAQQLADTHPQGLDVLINNAGIHLDLLSRWREPRLSEDGHEIHWRTNYLGSFHLTQRMLPLLLQRARTQGQARVVNVVSQLHNRGHNADLFATPARYNSWVAYGNSKLALMHMSNELQRRYADQGLRSCSLHPGAVYSQIANKGLAEAPGLSRMRQHLAPLEKAFMFNPQEGAQTSLHCATSPVLPAGSYFRRCRPARASEDAQDLQVARKLWQQSMDWLPDGAAGTLYGAANSAAG